MTTETMLFSNGETKEVEMIEPLPSSSLEAVKQSYHSLNASV